MTDKNINYDIIAPFNYNNIIEQAKTDNTALAGFEVTNPDHINGLIFNIDPQHTEKQLNNSATNEAYLNYKKYIEVLEEFESIKFVTTKADIDSIASMVILSIALQKDKETEEFFRSSEIIERIEFINIFDNNPTNLAAKPKDATEALKFLESQPGATAIREAMGNPDRNITVRHKVEMMSEWLKTGKFENQDKYQKNYETNKELLNNFKVQILPNGTVQIETHSNLAFMYGYTLGDVVFAIDNEFIDPITKNKRTKYTVAVNSEAQSNFNMQKFIEDINSKEANGKWGGSQTIAGDPQGKGSSQNINDIAFIVDKYNLSKPLGINNSNLAEHNIVAQQQR